MYLWVQVIVNVGSRMDGKGRDWEGDPCGEAVAGCGYKGGVAEVGVWGAGGGWGVLVCVGWVLGRFEDKDGFWGGLRTVWWEWVWEERRVVLGWGVWGVWG